MADNLTPQQLQALQQLMAMGASSGYVPQFGIPDGNGGYLAPMYDTSGAQGQNAQTPTLMGYEQNGPSGAPGTPYNTYDTSGNFQKSGTLKNANGYDLLALAALASLGMGAFLPGMTGAGALGGAGAASGADLSAFYGGLDGGATLGGGASIGGGSALAGSPLASEFASMGFDPSFASSAEFDMAPADAAPAGSSIMDAGNVAGGVTSDVAGGSGLSGLLGSLSPYGGLIAAGLGALAGSNPQKTTQTTTKDLPSWLAPYVTGQGGLLDQTQALMQKQMAPGYMAGYDQMRNVGQGLLSQPVAGNGFSRFFPGR